MACFTCMACKLKFAQAEQQRLHYKTDWHRYNLKRQMAQLPHVTEAIFNQKLDQYNSNKTTSAEEVSYNCEKCNKSFSTLNAYENHLKSKKHLTVKAAPSAATSKLKNERKNKDPKERKEEATVRAYEINESSDGQLEEFIEDIMGNDSDGWEDVESDEEVEEEDDEDLDSEALPPDHCLFCPHESVSIEDNLRHMLRSHSFFIPDVDFVVNIQAFLTYLGAKVGDGKVCLQCNLHSKQFTSISACQLHMRDKGHCQLDYEGDAALEYSDFYDFSASYPDGEEEDADEELASEMGQLTMDPDTMELILPSGNRIGHRSMRRYYAQSLPDPSQHPVLLKSISSHYRDSIVKVETRLSNITRAKMQKAENKARFHKNLAVSVKANKLQKFFRKQYMYAG